MGMSPQAFTLTGFDRVEFVQSWLVTILLLRQIAFVC